MRILGVPLPDLGTVAWGTVGAVAPPVVLGFALRDRDVDERYLPLLSAGAVVALGAAAGAVAGRRAAASVAAGGILFQLALWVTRQDWFARLLEPEAVTQAAPASGGGNGTPTVMGYYQRGTAPGFAGVGAIVRQSSLASLGFDPSYRLN